MTTEALNETPQGVVTIQMIAMPLNTNIHGDIFGGWLVSQMDLAGGIFARQYSHGRTVTVSINSMVFKNPVHVGDVISCYVSLVKRGKTSITLNIDVWSNTHIPEITQKVTTGVFVYVAVDSDGHPRLLPLED